MAGGKNWGLRRRVGGRSASTSLKATCVGKDGPPATMTGVGRGTCCSDNLALQAEQTQGAFRLPAQEPGSSRDVRGTCQPQKTDSQITERSHSAGACTLAHL